MTVTRKHQTREEKIASVVDAWNEIPARDKVDLMLLQPELYSACAWLAAHETVKKEWKRKR